MSLKVAFTDRPSATRMEQESVSILIFLVVKRAGRATRSGN